MSGIAAIVWFNGAPASSVKIAQMTRAMDYRGVDGIAHYVKGSIALGHCMLRTTFEASDECQPLTNEDQSLCLVMDGYLSNWEELRGALLDRGACLRTRSDAELVLRAYEIWGKECPTRIDGEFAFLIWDNRRQEVFCARDHQGLRPFFYHWDGQRLLAASDISPIIAALDERPPLNQGYFAEMLAEQWCSETETIWSGVMRVPHAHSMQIRANHLHLESYWRVPLDVRIRNQRDEDYVDHYREVLRDCVRRSSRSHLTLGFEVSGGLDSSSLFCLGSRILDEGQLWSSDIRGYTLQGLEGSDADEIEYARAAGGHVGRQIRETPLFTPGLEWFRQRAQSDCDVPGYPNGVMSNGLERAARLDGCRVLINGLGGDQWLTGTLNYAELIAEQSMPQIVRTLRDELRLSGWRATGKSLASELASPYLPAGVFMALRTLVAKPSVAPLWLSDSARVELGHRQRGYANRLRANGPGHYKVAKLGFPYHLHALDLIARQRAQNGIEGRSPMLMRSFIEFSATTPERLRLRGGVSKWIHRKAMQEVMPELIVNRRSKAEFSVAWHAIGGALTEWVRRQLESNFPATLDRQGSERMLEMFGNSAIDEKPFWELWSIFVFLALSDEHPAMNQLGIVA